MTLKLPLLKGKPTWSRFEADVPNCTSVFQLNVSPMSPLMKLWVAVTVTVFPGSMAMTGNVCRVKP